MSTTNWFQVDRGGLASIAKRRGMAFVVRSSACVANEKDQGKWNGQFQDLLDGVRDDTVMTIVDCHV